MKKKTVKILLPIVLLLLVALVILFLVPTIVKNKELKSKNALAEALEKERVEKLEQDKENFLLNEYDGVFISMTEASDFNSDIFYGYIGKNVLKAGAVVESSDEFMDLWLQAEMSENPLSYCVFIIDPFKMYDEEKNDNGEEVYTLNLNIDSIFTSRPNTDFRVFTPFYSIDYWEKSHTEESFERALKGYKEVMTRFSSHDNVSLSSFTAYDWVTKNPSMFNEKGGLESVTSTALFLYNYKDYWKILPKDVDEKIDLMKKNLFFEDSIEEKESILDFYFKKKSKPSVEYAYPGMEDYDVVFLGDSIFALFDGPFSIPTYFTNMTGARVYNLSKGGLTTVHYSDENMSMSELIDYVIAGKKVSYDGFDAFNRDVERFANDDHSDRKLLFVTDMGVNDYIFNISAEGDGESYEKAFKEGIDYIKGNYPDASILSMSIYNIVSYEGGKLINESGCVLNDYKKVMENICKEENIPYIDMETYSSINGENAAYYLDDGLHPSMAGSYEVSKRLCEYISNNK